MGDLNPVWTVHVVVAGAEALRATDPPARAGLRLPHGFGTSRWLSAGASESVGWPLLVENLLNQDGPGHVVLNLSRTDFPDIALVDELHPRYDDGLQRAARIADQVKSRLSDAGLRATLGGLVVHPSSVLPASALRKICVVARRLGFEPLVAGMDPDGLPAVAPRTNAECLQVAEIVARALAATGGDQDKAARISRAKAGSSGSRAPIE